MPSGNRLTLVLSSLLFGAALAGRTGLAQESAPPLPPPRPDAAQAPAGREGGPGNAEAPLESLLPADPACLESLTRLGVRFEPRQSFAEGACRVHGPVLVSGLPDGVDVSPPALMTCPMAEGLARWILDTVLAAAERHFQTAPTKLVIGTSYECRNQRSGAKLSEHAFGNGVDVMGFEFHKRASALGRLPPGGPLPRPGSNRPCRREPARPSRPCWDRAPMPTMAIICTSICAAAAATTASASERP